MSENIAQLKDRMQKNQEDWAITFKELEYQQPVLVTSGVLKTILCLLLPIDSYVVVQILDTGGTTYKTWQLRG